MTASADVNTRHCPVCGETVPAAKFCGACGAESGHPGGGRNLLPRPRVYAADPREKVWTPSVGSTFFPRLPARLRAPFRLGLILVVIAIIILGSLRVNGPLGVTAVIGWPLLFLIYVWQSDVFRDVPLRILAVVTVLGLALGVSWWLLGAKVLAGAYGVSTGSAFALADVLDIGWLLTAGGAALMVLPAFVARLFPMSPRESLDGFVIGAFGALWCEVAATTTIVAPQFVEGLIEEQSAGRMLQDAISYGVVNPIVAAAAGGVVGIRLWFTPARRRGLDPKRTRRTLTLLAAAAAPAYLAVWTVDAVGLPRPVDIALKLGLAGLALLVIRCAVQVSLLCEKPDPSTGEAVLCPHCEQVVPDLPFCSSCGAAARASSRTSRRLRREYSPLPEVVQS